MTEFDLKQALGQDIELPKAVEERLAQACAQATADVQPVRRRRPLRAVRIGAAAAAAAAILSVGAMAVSLISHGPIYQAFFGNETYQSTEYTEFYDKYGNFHIASVNEERVPVDEEQAEALVGEYLSDKGYTWQIGEYTLTVESYLLDENTGTAKVSYSLYCPRGIQGLVVDDCTGHVYADGTSINMPNFCVLIKDESRPSYGTYLPAARNNRVDLTRSTEDTLYITTSLAQKGWEAADGMRIEWLFAPEDQSVILELPALESLPAVTGNNPETGAPAVVLSAIGMKVWVEDIDQVDYVALTYADGTQYVLKDDASNWNNTDCACGFGERPHVEVLYGFNRLVDPEQVVSVTVNGSVYAVIS